MEMGASIQRHRKVTGVRGLFSGKGWAQELQQPSPDEGQSIAPSVAKPEEGEWWTETSISSCSLGKNSALLEDALDSLEADSERSRTV